MYVGSLTADELIFAGESLNEINFNHFLMNKWNLNRKWILTLTPKYFYASTNSSSASHDYLFYLSSNRGSTSDGVAVDSVVRPSISLLFGTEIISGDGTLSNPCEIK